MRSRRTSTTASWLPRAVVLAGGPAAWHPPIRLIGLLDQLVGRLAVA